MSTSQRANASARKAAFSLHSNYTAGMDVRFRADTRNVRSWPAAATLLLMPTQQLSPTIYHQPFIVLFCAEALKFSAPPPPFKPATRPHPPAGGLSVLLPVHTLLYPCPF